MRILYIENNDVRREECAAYLAMFCGHEVRAVAGVAAAPEILGESRFDVLVVGNTDNDHDAMKLLRDVHRGVYDAVSMVATCHYAVYHCAEQLNIARTTSIPAPYLLGQAIAQLRIAAPTS